MFASMLQERPELDYQYRPHAFLFKVEPGIEEVQKLMDTCCSKR
jgi:hypothetical protein